MRSKLDLVVVCENFGITFSGGSTATARLINEMQTDFNSISIICKITDGYLMDQLDFIYYESLSEINQLLSNFPKDKTILYGDFHKFHEALKSELPFYFTYHDNWPEIAEFIEDKTSVKNTIAKYKEIFSAANTVFSVSEHKVSFIAESSKNVVVVRNGLSQKILKTQPEKYLNGTFRILMNGNIGFRKYGKAIELFEHLEKLNLPLQIDVFGNVGEPDILEKMKVYDFVHYKGFHKVMDHNGYHLLLQTSVNENMSLSAVDAIANYTPIVSFDVGGIQELISHDNGRIIQPFDIQLMATTIQELVSDFPKFTYDNNKLKPFNWTTSAQKMVNIIYANTENKTT